VALVALNAVGASAIKVRPGIIGVDLDCLREICKGAVAGAFDTVRDTPANICCGVSRIDFNRLIIIYDCSVLVTLGCEYIAAV
jgi:hypothetical protein